MLLREWNRAALKELFGKQIGQVTDCRDRGISIRKSDFISDRAARPKLDGVMIVRIAPELGAKVWISQTTTADEPF